MADSRLPAWAGVERHPTKFIALRLLASLFHPSSYLEVGVREGHSLAEVVRGAGDSLKRLCLCDDWGRDSDGTGRTGHDHLARLLHSLGYTGEVQWLDGDSHKVLRPGTAGQKFNLILIDGDHTAVGARQDLLDCAPLLAEGGLLVFDDIHHRQHTHLTEVVRQFLADEPRFEMACELRDEFSGVAVMRRIPK